MEGSRISAKRTAASAALAADCLAPRRDSDVIGIIGCGPNGLETLRFLFAVRTRVAKIVIYDLHADRMRQFEEKARELDSELDVVSADSADA